LSNLVVKSSSGLLPVIFAVIYKKVWETGGGGERVKITGHDCFAYVFVFLGSIVVFRLCTDQPLQPNPIHSAIDSLQDLV